MAENEKVEQTGESGSDKADKAKKDKKSEKKSKPGFFARIGKWLKDMKVELKKVVWPTGKQTVNNTLIVIACVIVVGIFIWLFDAVAGGADHRACSSCGLFRERHGGQCELVCGTHLFRV